MILWLVFSLLSAVLYRLGGCIQTKIRDFGVPTVAMTYMIFPWRHGCSLWVWGALLFHFGLLFATLTTYWKKKGTDARWWNWAITGAAYSIAAFPIAWATGHWLGFGVRCITLTTATCLWSQFVSWDVAEESGRGFLITATLPLLLL